jgi:hypothetical protein
MTPILQTATPSPRTPKRSLRSWSLSALSFSVLLAWTIGLQWAGGAYRAEFSGYPDEPAHYVSGLMVRDYLAAGFPVSPLKYAEDYYMHYPKVAFGMWGPLPHLAEGIWMLVFSWSRTSILLMMAVVTTVLAYALSQVLWTEFSYIAGLAAGMGLVAVRFVQLYTGMVMADNLCALFDFLAILCFGRFLASDRRRDAVFFGLFACLSVLTKGNGIALALVPPFGVLITRRFDLFKRLNFWIPAAMVVAVAGPWQYISSRLLSGIATRVVDWRIAAAYGPMFVSILGPWLLPIVLVGIYDRVVVPFRHKAVQSTWAAAAALLPAFWVFHGLVPSASAEERYVIAVVAPLLMFFTAGLAKIAALISTTQISYRIKASALAVLSALIFAGTSFGIPQKQSYGFSEVAQYITSRPEAPESVMLISSEAFGEGIMIAEIAMRDHRPGLIVLRATKLLARLNWVGENYELLYRTPEETMARLQEIPVRFLVVDKTPGLHPIPHHQNILKMLAMYPDRWQSLGIYPQKVPVTARNCKIEVYRLVGGENRPRSKIRLDLRYSLGRFIEQ